VGTGIIDSERRFQVWKYTVGHGQLLLRSTKSDEFPSRIDVFFKGVQEFHLPTGLTGLSIAEASEEDVRQLCTLRKVAPAGKDVKVFRVQGRDYLGYVSALIVLCHEDDGDYHDPSFFAENNII